MLILCKIVTAGGYQLVEGTVYQSPVHHKLILTFIIITFTKSMSCVHVCVSPNPSGMNSSVPKGKPLMLASLSRTTPEM